jgi:hypothetical protein
VGQQVSEFTLSHFGFGQQSDRIGQAAKIIQKRSVKLLGIYDIIYAILPDETCHFFIDGFVEKFFPSFEFLLGWFGVLLHFFSPDSFVDLELPNPDESEK